jgi:TatD DNase family protein
LGDGPVLLFVGRIQPLKGADLAVRALAEVTGTEPAELCAALTANAERVFGRWE